MLTSAQCNQDQFYLLIATAVGGSIFLVKTGSVLSINQQDGWILLKLENILQVNESP